MMVIEQWTNNQGQETYYGDPYTKGLYKLQQICKDFSEKIVKIVDHIYV